MTPFELADIPKEYRDPNYISSMFNVPYEKAVEYAATWAQEVYVVNDQYQVHISGILTLPDWPATIHLSIKRIDQQPIHDWRDLQTIKNMLVGPEHDAVEVYPAESKLVDCANQYHLWVFADPEIRLPIGWQKRMVRTPAEAEAVGAKQRG